jgi:ornithine lipid ester-linked acyl 2-hydroxylase
MWLGSEHRFERLGRQLDRHWDAIRFNVPYWPVMAYNLCCWVLLPNQTFVDRGEVPGVEVLEQNWKAIRAELDDLLLERATIPAFQEVDPGQRRLTDDDRWKTFVFRLYGADAPANRERCPDTSDVLDRIPNLYTAFFSILGPQKRLPLHAGPLKSLVRVHLALLVPEGECWIEIAGRRCTWTEGELLIFDDTHLHRAYNGTDQDRVVVFIDIVRRMPWRWLDRVNRWVLHAMTRSPRIQSAIARAEAATDVRP